MPEFRYTNPIIRDASLSLRDHQIIKVSDRWYLTGTAPPFWSGNNPGVRLLCSDDLLNWSHCAWLIDATTLPDDAPYNGRFWAPEIHVAKERFWLTVNSGNAKDGDPRRMHDHAIWLFVSDAIAGPYRMVGNHGPIGTPFKNDASLFTDIDNRTYCYCSGGGLWQSEIDLKTGRLIGGDDFVRFCSPKDSDIPEWMSGGVEGPFVVRRDGLYHLFFSSWTRGYEVGVMTSPSPLGPWTLTPESPILGTRKRRFRQQQMIDGGYAHLQFADTDDPYAETGHCAVFEGPDGGDWLCCHYLLQGRRPIGGGPVLEYEDAQPQLGIEPLKRVARRIVTASAGADIFRTGCSMVIPGERMKRIARSKGKAISLLRVRMIPADADSQLAAQ